MPSAKTVLNLGLGAGAIERYLSEAFPRIKVTSVEISQERLDQASHYFGIPGSCNIIIQDALTFLQQGTLEQDIIYCDLFDIRNNFNKPLTNTFIHCLWKGLANSGIAVINYAFEAQDKLIGTLVELRKIFTTTAVLEVKDHTNRTSGGI